MSISGPEYIDDETRDESQDISPLEIIRLSYRYGEAPLNRDGFAAKKVPHSNTLYLPDWSRPTHRELPKLVFDAPQPTRTMQEIWSQKPEEVREPSDAIDAQIFDTTYQQRIYKNGHRHVYRVGSDGKLTHISHTKVLEEWGYAIEDSIDNYKLKNQADKSIVTDQLEQTADGNSESPATSQNEQMINSISVEPSRLLVSGLRRLSVGLQQIGKSLKGVFNKSLDARDDRRKSVDTVKNKYRRRAYMAALGAAVLGATFTASTSHNESSAKFAAPFAVDIKTSQQKLPEIRIPKQTHGSFKTSYFVKGHSAQYTTERINSPNDTIWAHAENRLKNELGHQPSDSQILKLSKHILMLNLMSWGDARNMQLHQSFQVPEEID